MKTYIYIISTLAIVAFFTNCNNSVLNTRKEKPDFEIIRINFLPIVAISTGGINPNGIDSQIIRKYKIKQLITYRIKTKILLLSIKEEWIKDETCTFDTNGIMVNFKRFDDYGISNIIAGFNERKSSEEYWLANEHHIKRDSFYFLEKYKVENKIGRVYYDSIFEYFDNKPEYETHKYRNDTVDININGNTQKTKIFKRDISNRICQVEIIDKQGISERITYDYKDNKIARVIKQDLGDRTNSIFIDIYEYNENGLQVNYKCIAIDNSNKALQDYISGKNPGRVINEIKCEWILN